MLVYEVNLNLSTEVFEDYFHWLMAHVEQMLKFPGFLEAKLLKELDSNEDGKVNLTLHYYVETRAHLDDYLDHHAQQMRAEGLLKFSGKFTATRRFFEVINKDSFKCA